MDDKKEQVRTKILEHSNKNKIQIVTIWGDSVIYNNYNTKEEAVKKYGKLNCWFAKDIAIVVNNKVLFEDEF